MSRRRVTPDEADLWRRVTRDVRPSDLRREALARSQPERPEVQRQGVIAHAPAQLTPRAKAPLSAGLRAASAAPHPQAPASSVLGAGDPARDRLVASGRIAIERVFDLHGMTQARAETALSRFIAAAFQDGCRCVLVITGKGGPASQASMTRRRFGYGSSGDDALRDDAPRGLLRERFLDWVDGPTLRPMIARVSQARPRDGGAGAFYVFLRRPAARGARR